jgi:hypothetical protein
MDTAVITAAKHARDALENFISALETDDSVARRHAQAWDKMETPSWDWQRWYELLKDVEDAGGAVPSADWARMGIERGYDPRGLGGFFTYDGSMAKDGDMRVLTENGRAFIRIYEKRYGARAAQPGL